MQGKLLMGQGFYGGTTEKVFAQHELNLFKSTPES
jgi:hypothetical protein